MFSATFWPNASQRVDFHCCVMKMRLNARKIYAGTSNVEAIYEGLRGLNFYVHVRYFVHASILFTLVQSTCLLYTGRNYVTLKIPARI